MTKLSNDERKKVIEGFYDEVARGTAMDEGWKKRMVEASSPVLPDEPSPEQLDAWIELAEIVSDESFVATMKASVQKTWIAGFDHVAYTRAAQRMADEHVGVDPQSAEAKAIVDRCLEGFAAARGTRADDAFRRDLRKQYDEMDPRASRYWDLVSILRGDPPRKESPEWAWFRAASRHHFP